MCTTSGLAFRKLQRNGKMQFFLHRNTFFECRHCAAVLQTRIPKLYTDLDLSLFYILILGTYSKFARKNIFQALGVCFPQPCSSAGRRFAASRSHLQYYRQNCFVFTTKISRKCVVNWIPLRIRTRSRNAQS